MQTVYIKASHDHVFLDHLDYQIVHLFHYTGQHSVTAALYNTLYRTACTVNIEQVSERVIFTALV